MSEGDAVRVCLRARPLIHREQGEDVNLLWKTDNNTISQVDGTRSFSFDRVFHSHETTAQVYQEVAVPIIHSALQGYNGTIFAYGQTSSGKTYTMMGAPNNLGIIPQAVKEIFKIIHEIPNREFLLRVSYMEIYNETVTDLLCDDRKKKPLEIREDINRNVYVADLTEELVMAPEHIMEWIKKGEKNRHYGETKMNDHSSRSHTIFRMIVESRERNDPGNSENCDGAVMVSHLNLVDLAGSERASQTGAEGVRFKEGCNINRSLFILGQVIKKLSDGQVGGFINYRDSKLTRILQNSLGGNTKTVIICTVTLVSLDETLSTLQFASTAKHVRNTPHVNEVLDDQALLKRYRKEIVDLKKQLEELEASSEIKTHAMAKEEYSQMLTEIQQLQKEREDRIWNLTKIVVASSQQFSEDQRVKRKRRVTWAPGKLHDSLRAAVVPPFEIGSKLAVNSAKRPKVSEISPIMEIDDSICTEFSDFDDASRVLDDFVQDADCSFGKVTRRGKTALSHSMIDFPSESASSLEKESSLQKCKEMEQKVAELEKRLSKLTAEYDVEVGKRESLEKETADLKHQLESRDETEERVRTLELEITGLKDQIHTRAEYREQSPVPGDCLEIPDRPTPPKTDHEQESPIWDDSPLRTPTDGEGQDPFQEQLSPDIHDLCREQIQMLELKLADLEGSGSPEKLDPNDLRESLQICDALMAEKQSAQDEVAFMQNNIDQLVAENESLRREMACLEKCLQERQETNEFEMLEKETQKEHEAQLIHEISSLKRVVENAEVYNQELENEVENKSKLLKDVEKQLAELKREYDILQKRVSYSDLSASMGEGEKLCDEVFQMRQSLTDAETVTRDAQREAAFLRSKNLELKEQMDELSIRCEKREKDASDCEKQLEIEKSNYKRMQADLQKELQHAFNEINQLNGLMAGKVPKDLLDRVELDRKIADFSKQLASLSEEKNVLVQEVAGLLEYKSLPAEVEHLKDQVQRTSEELVLLKNEKEQSASIIMDQKHRLLEQTEQIEKLTEEVTRVQAECQHAEHQYSALKTLHESLEEKCSLAAEDLNKKDRETECLMKEMDELKHSLECIEQNLSALLEEKDELNNAKQALETHVKELEELLKSSCAENDNLQGQVNNLSSEVLTLQQQTEKQDLEAKYNALVAEKEQLEEQLHNSSSSDVLLPEHAEASRKLQELQAECNLAVQHRDELLVKLEELEAEKDNLKQDLNENIELSIETQDELRTTQEELKQQKQLLADLRKELADSAGDASPQAESQGNVPEEEKDDVKCLQLQEQMLAICQEEDALRETLKNISAERDQLKLDLQENIEMSINTQEELRSALDELKVKTQLLESLNTQTNEIKVETNEDLSSKEESYLINEIENLKEQLQTIKKQLEDAESVAVKTSREVNDLHGCEEQSQECADMEINLLEENVTKNPTLLEEMQGEKMELLSKLGLLQEELAREAVHRDDLQGKLESALNDHAHLKEHSDSVLACLSRTQEELQSCREELNQQINLVNNLRMEASSSTSSEEKETATDLMPSLEEEVLCLKEKLLQKNTEYQQLIQDQEKLEQDKDLLSSQVEGLLKDMKETQSMLESLQNEKLETGGQLLDLQQQMEKIVQERDHLKNAQQRYISKLDQENQTENNDQAAHFENEPEQRTPDYPHEDLVQSNLALNNDLELLKMNLKQSEAALEMLRSEKNDGEQKRNDLQRQVELHTEELENLKVAQQCLVSERDQLKEEFEKNVEKLICLQEEVLQNANVHHELIQKKEELEQEQISLKCERENLMKTLMEAQSTLEHIQNEKLESEEQLTTLQQQMDGITQEKDELQTTKERLTLEMASLKEQMNMEDNRQRIPENEETTQAQPICSQVFETSLKDMEAELASLRNEKSNVEEKLYDLQQQMEIMTPERDELKVRIQSLISERDQLKEDLGENIEMSIETQEDLRKTRDDLQQQRHGVEELTCKIASLEQKLSSVENELLEKVSLLKEVHSERQNLQQSKEALESELEHLHSDIKNKDSALEESEQMRSEAGQKITDLTAQLKTASEERDQVQLTKEELQKLFTETQDELRRTREELQQQEQRVEKLTNDISVLEEKSSSLERELQEKIHVLNKAVEDGQLFDQSNRDLTSEMEQVIEDLKSKEFDLKQAVEEKEAASQKILELANEVRSITQERDSLQQLKENLEEEAKKCHQYELEVARLHQEQEQFQQLLQRARSEKENIYASLQDQEKAVAQLQDELITSQTRLQTVKEERDESNAQLAEKVNDINEMLQEISYLKEQMQLLHQEMKDEKMKNTDLRENVGLLEKEIEALRSILSEPAQEEDELAENTEMLEKKNQEWKDLMVNISTVYSNHHSLLNNLSSDLQSEAEAQHRSMSSIKESLLSSAHSGAFGNLQAEHVKLNSQMQTLLNKFKVLYRNAAVKDEHYNLAKDMESELCAVQKKNEELLLQCESLEQHGTKWSQQAAEDLRFRELEFINQLIYKKALVIKHVEDDFSEVQVALSSMEKALKEEIKCKKEFIVWLEEFNGVHLDTRKLSDGVLEENRRIAGVVQHFMKTLRIIARSKAKKDSMMYVNGLEKDLKEEREKNNELLQKMQQIAPSGDSNILEEENAQLRETLKNVQVDLKKMQCRIQDLENQLSSARSDGKQKEQRALLLEEKLRSNTAESELPEMRAKMNEKEKHYQAALKEIQILQEKVGKGAAPYRDEIDSLKNQVVRVEMERMKLAKSSDQQIASLKVCIEDKEERLRKLKEQLRRTQTETETTICPGNSSSLQYPLTCGGGSGIVQSTALLMLQSENAALKREIAQYKKKLHQLSRNISSREDELKKQKDQSSETPTSRISSLHQDEGLSHNNTDLYRGALVSPKKSEIPTCHIASPGKTGTHRKRVLSPSRTDVHKPQPMSPIKVERHSVPAMSPGNAGLYKKRPASPLKNDGPFFSTLTLSPCKKKNLPEAVDSPKDKFFDGRSKSLPYCPSNFFDNSTLGTLPDPCPPPSDSNPCVESDKDLYAGITTETGDGNNWWDQAGKTEKPNDCKTS